MQAQEWEGTGRATDLGHFLCCQLLFPFSASMWLEICLFSVHLCQNPPELGSKFSLVLQTKVYATAKP